VAIAQGIFKKLVFKKQTGLGAKATASGAQVLRRVSSNLDLSKDTYESNEIIESQQVRDMRHGLRKVEGTISGELSVGTYQSFIESALRAPASAAISSGALIDVTAASDGAGTYTGTFTTVAANWLTLGFKTGMVLRWTGWTATANNNINYRITSLTATVMSVVALNKTDIVAETAGASVTALTVGKHISVPTSGHTRDYYTIEHLFSDISQSEQFVDCVIGSVDVKMPPTGLSTIDFPIVGLDMDTGTSAYFTSPTASSSGDTLAAVNGSVYISGSPVATITGFDVSINGNAASIGAVVGSNIAPDVQVGKVKVTGNMTVLFQDTIMRDYFNNETEVSIVATMTGDNTDTAESVTFILPRVKIGGASKDDGEKGLVMTMPFSALENTTGGTGTDSFNTTVTVQDSAYV